MSTESVVIGPGYVGKATAFALQIDLLIGRNDIFPLSDYKYFILCVPTPTGGKGIQDITAIEEWLNRIKDLNKDKGDKVVIIRSTILPGTTEMLSEKYDLHVVHIPEFLSENSAIEDELNPEFVVIGCRDIVIREKMKKLFLPLERDVKFILCDSVTAEFIKYSMNSYFTLKVIYGNQLWDAARECGANYSKVKEALESHKWGSKNGWDVWYGGFRGFMGKCLPKDLYAFTKKFKLPLLDTVRQINKKLVSTTI